ncbi:ABC transporter ATP-binding protein [Acuticoccus mangrovi]|uniref:Spermidine/putrescine import ATP-binding protein PotA n=1 Tax=Acuticoccus mangrovi TaxID=2796142 RepID=A0A934MN90_9HYPH|nr:ABC transporter ATP-binding protein [Acuticoccus mangrovi]MBJ3777974.1 ABC transporter ATP-binding protein [Acuticoccus mangrovi]
MSDNAIDTSTPMISLDGVRKEYADVIALDTTDLQVAKGEFMTLLGPSGSGKTTLLNLIAGMTSPTAGRVVIAGTDVTATPPAKRGLGMVFQNYALMPHMTIFQNIAFPLHIRHLPKREINRRVRDVLELIQLPHVADRKPKELSGGQQQRISLARCIVYNPNIILMDEPLGALDKNLREQMQIEIKRLHKELGVTILYVTHDQEEALNMSDRIVLMKGGKIEQLGTTDELYFDPASVFAADFLGQSTLIEATVRTEGDPAILEIAGGTRCRVSRGTCTAGTRGTLMFRPEAARLAQPGEATGDANVVSGELKHTIATGSVVKHYVGLPNGDTVIVQELANQHRTRLPIGIQVTVSWPVEAGLFLNG